MTPYAIDAQQLMQMAPLGGQLGHPRLQMSGGPSGTVGGMSDLQNLVNRVHSQQLQRCPAPELGTHDQTHLASVGASTMPHTAGAYGGQAPLPYSTTSGGMNLVKTSSAQPTPTTGSADSSSTDVAISHQQQQQITCHGFSGTNDFNSATADHGVIFFSNTSSWKYVS